MSVNFIGIDLSAFSKNNTGIAIIKGNRIETITVHSNEEILRRAKGIVAIDAPLFLPKGIKRIRKGMPLRECDKELVRRKIKFFPLQFGSMKELTKRGIYLKQKIEGEAIETYPGAVYKLSNLSREEAIKLIEKYYEIKPSNKDEKDAIICAIVAKAHYLKQDIEIGNPKEGLMHLVDLKRFLNFIHIFYD